MNRLCGGVGGRTGLGGRGGCEEKLKTMGELVVEQVRKAEMIVGIFRFGVKLRGKAGELSRREIEQMRRVR